jgi:putative endonuclease
MDFAVYITTNPDRKVLYTGVTNNLSRRLVEHYLERGNPETFAGKNYCYNLVYYDTFPTMIEAIEAEKRIKGKSREWKEELITSFNPNRKFINLEIVGEWPPRKILEDPYFQNYIG